MQRQPLPTQWRQQCQAPAAIWRALPSGARCRTLATSASALYDEFSSSLFPAAGPAALPQFCRQALPPRFLKVEYSLPGPQAASPPFETHSWWLDAMGGPRCTWGCSLVLLLILIPLLATGEAPACLLDVHAAPTGTPITVHDERPERGEGGTEAVGRRLSFHAGQRALVWPSGPCSHLIITSGVYGTCGGSAGWRGGLCQRHPSSLHLPLSPTRLLLRSRFKLRQLGRHCRQLGRHCSSAGPLGRGSR